MIITSHRELHRQKPATNVHYSKYIIICIANILLLICISICEGTCQTLRHLCRSGQQNLKMFWKRYVLKHGFHSGDEYWDSQCFYEYVLYFPPCWLQILYDTPSTFMYLWMVPVNIGSNSLWLPSNLVIIDNVMVELHHL